MIHKLKLLTFALVIAAALTALTATAAMAAPDFTASSYPMQMTGLNSKEGEVWGTEGGNVSCNSHYLTNSNSEASSTLSVDITFSSCLLGGGQVATVNPEGCQFIFHATELVSSGVYRHHIDISCPAGKSIKFSSGSCRWEIKSQNGLTTAKTTNISGGTLFIQPELKSIAYTVTQDGLFCTFNGTGNKTDGTFGGFLIASKIGGGSLSVSGA